MKSRFYSKVDWWLWIILGFSIIYEILAIIKLPSVLSNIIGIIVIVFISWILFGTHYEFNEDYLLIRSGPSKEKIFYKDIKRISSKKSVVASSCLSTDRIEIICNGRFGGYVSPKDKEQFIEILKSKCINLH